MISKHNDKYHPKRVTILECEQCTFTYTKPDSLELHRIVHNSNPPYQGPECEYVKQLILFILATLFLVITMIDLGVDLTVLVVLFTLVVYRDTKNLYILTQ